MEGLGDCCCGGLAGRGAGCARWWRAGAVWSGVEVTGWGRPGLAPPPLLRLVSMSLPSTSSLSLSHSGQLPLLVVLARDSTLPARDGHESRVSAWSLCHVSRVSAWSLCHESRLSRVSRAFSRSGSPVSRQRLVGRPGTRRSTNENSPDPAAWLPHKLCTASGRWCGCSRRSYL